MNLLVFKYHASQSLKGQFEIGRPLLKSRNIAIDYQWPILTIWPSKPDLLGQMVRIGQKMANGRLLFQALHQVASFTTMEDSVIALSSAYIVQ